MGTRKSAREEAESFGFDLEALGFPPPSNYRELDPGMKKSALDKLADEMKTAGESWLFVEKENLAVDSLDFLERFDHLTHLQIGGIARGIRVVSRLKQLTELELINVKVTDYAFLADLKNLISFCVNQGSCKDFGSLRHARKLKELTFWRVSSLDDVGFLADMKSLVSIDIEDSPRITAFPSLAGLSRLKEVRVTGLRGLTELDGILEAPKLKELAVGPLPGLPLEAFASLDKARSLEHLSLGIALEGSKRQEEAKRLVPDRIKIN